MIRHVSDRCTVLLTMSDRCTVLITMSDRCTVLLTVSDRCTVPLTIKWSNIWVTGVQYSLQWETGVQYSYNQMIRHMNDRCVQYLQWVACVQYSLQSNDQTYEWQVYSTPEQPTVHYRRALTHSPSFRLGEKAPQLFQISKDQTNLVINTALFSMTGFKGTDVLCQLLTSRETRQWRKGIYKKAQQNKKACIHTILWTSSFFCFLV